MANRHRGEISATLAGQPRRLCLTLGALAELEDAFRAEDLTALAGRFASGRLSAHDLIEVLKAGLAGAGETLTEIDIAALGREETIADLAAIAGELLAAAFGTAPPTSEGGPDPS
jgi:hypothetical protein